MVIQREHTRARLPEETPLDRHGNWTYADGRHSKDTAREDTLTRLRTAAAERAAAEKAEEEEWTWDLMLEGAGPIEYDDPDRPEPEIYELAYGTTAAGTEVVAYSTGVHTWIEDPEEGDIDPPMLQNCMEPAVIREWTLWQMGFRGIPGDRVEWINKPGLIKLPAE